MRLPIFAYHSIDDSGSVISTAPSEFERQMHYLWKENYKSISLGECIESALMGKITAKKPFVLTFDDGFKNTYEVAFPILKSYGFTATIFVVTDFIGQRTRWIKDKGIPDLPLLSWDEIIEMNERGISIQSHSKTHPDLTGLDRKGIEEEIISSKREIEERLGNRVESFCYPHGKFDGRVIETLKLVNFIGAVTIRFGWNNNSMDPFMIKRIGSRRFRKYPVVFRLCLSRTGCRLISFAIRLRSRGSRR